MMRALELSRVQASAFWLPTAYLMTLAAQGRRAVLHPLRCVFLLLCAAGMMGGTLTALQGATGSLLSAYALGVVLMTLMTASLLRARRAAADVRQARIVCRYRGKTARFEAMIDSGNTLRDYLTHDPVIVMPKAVGIRLFALEDEPLRPIFADTAGGRQMMDVFVPGETFLLAKGRAKRVDAAVALSGALSKDAPALVPASLFNEE